MKTLLIFVLTGLASLTCLSQTTSIVNITFRGINKSTSNFQVMLDQKSYYSNVNTDNSANFKIAITNVSVGMHALKVYKLKNNDPYYNSNEQTLIYSKNFEVRSGYEMNIVILPTGQVQFSEQTSGVTVNTPVAAYEFNQLIQSVRIKRTQALKTAAIKDAFNNTAYYFSTSQIRRLLNLITSESSRLDLAKLSYRGVTDPFNFASLSDLFNNTSYRTEFNNYVAAQTEQPAGSAGVAMTDYNFSLLLQNVKGKWSQALKAEAEHDAFINSNNYFSTSQIRQLLTLITSESDRLDLAKLSYRGVSDAVNFASLSDLFNSTSYRTEFNNYVAAQTAQPASTAGVAMSDYNFNILVQNVKGKWSQALKAEAERDAFINSNDYFSTSQIRQLLTLITSESDRLDLAKLSYRGVTDAVNFASLSNLFNNTSYRTEFNNYVAAQTGQPAGTTGVAMTDYNFNLLVQNVNSKWSQALKAETERDAFLNSNNYFSTSQIGQLLNLITSESDRLTLAKFSYRSVTDALNFSSLADMFDSSANKEEFYNYIRSQGGTTPETAKVAMSDSNFSILLLSVRSNLLQILKVSAEREIFNRPDYYFTANQVKQLISLINSENNRLELAKLSYKTVIDPDNFTQLNDLFKVQANIDALANYVKTY